MNSTTSTSSSRKYIYIQGGLGNQLFQIALAKFLREREINTVICPILLGLGLQNSTKRKFDTRQLVGENEIQKYKPTLLYLNSRIFKIDDIFIEDDLFSFDQKKIDLIMNKSHLFGYFQSLKLVESVKSKILSDITKKIEIKNPINNLTVHVRAGDYLKSKNQQYHGLLTKKYYETAIEQAIQINPKIKNLTVVTDDIHYSRYLFQKVSYIQPINYVGNRDPWRDLEVLTNSQAIIMANSSFSWWAGFFGHNFHSSTVIMPKLWTAQSETAPIELVNHNWIVL